jgi:nicotinate-nucleotide pyrophosphorylase (carboxylating)
MRHMDNILLEKQVLDAVHIALNEDKAHEDITSQACIDSSVQVQGELILKQNARIAGLAFLPIIIDAVGLSRFHIHAQEGNVYEAGTILATVYGDAHAILKIERTALNLLQHTSGIATLTAQFVQEIEGYACAILDTRKTLPGLRLIQKYAVRLGGGKNHRFDLKERILIKNNHLKILSRFIDNPIQAAMEKARLKFFDIPIEIEINSLDMLEAALQAKPDAILLDNLSVEAVKAAVQHCRRAVYLEASGGISLSTVRAYAQTGIDAVSIGALTHSAPAVDISLRINYGT